MSWFDCPCAESILKVISKFDVIIGQNRVLTKKVEDMALKLDVLQAEVERSKQTITIATSLIGQLAQLIVESAEDPVKVAALAEQLKMSTDVLQTAIDAVPNQQDPDPVA